MSEIIIEYLFFGLGFYTGIATWNRRAFKNATFISIVNGFLLGLLLWPIAIYLITTERL